MAKMVPDPLPREVREDPRRSAECLVYDALKQMLPENFVVYYSRTWIGRNSDGQISEGESDFTILHPAFGMLCLEVKGGRISRDGTSDVWTTTDRSGEVFTIKNPMTQAARSRYHLLDKFRRTKGWADKAINCKHGIVLPHSAGPGFDLGAEIPRNRTIFSEDISRIDECVMGMLTEDPRAFAHKVKLGSRGMQAFERILSPSFDLSFDLNAEVDLADSKLARLTEDQFLILDCLTTNPRMAISGPAGTGKTVLAAEKATRLCAEGRRTLLLCYNAPLAERLKMMLKCNELIHVATFHQWCGETIKRAGIKIDEPGISQEELFSSVLPNAVQKALMMDLSNRFDAVIVDEAQDFWESWWIPIDTALATTGESVLYVFYDDNQSIYTNVSEFVRGLDTAHYRLNKNLRNTTEIFEYAFQLYRGGIYIAPERHGPAVEWINSANDDQNLQNIVDTAQTLTRTEHIDPRSICILCGSSTLRDAVIGKSNEIKKLHFRRFEDCDSGAILTETIHRFKGLESSIIILSGLEDLKNYRELLYVGLTRSKFKVILICSRSARSNFRINYSS